MGMIMRHALANHQTCCWPTRCIWCRCICCMQDVGFVTVGEMHIVKNPGLPTDPQQPSTTGNTDTASQQDTGSLQQPPLPVVRCCAMHGHTDDLQGWIEGTPSFAHGHQGISAFVQTRASGTKTCLSKHTTGQATKEMSIAMQHAEQHATQLCPSRRNTSRCMAKCNGSTCHQALSSV